MHEHHPQQLVYGCMGLGGSWDPTPYTRRDVAVAEAAVAAALEIGIRLFDHADIYRSGKAESVFGEILHGDAGLRQQIQIQTKCGIRLGEGGLTVHYDSTKHAILDRVRASLKRLRVDQVDTLLLHRPDPLARPEEVAEALTELHAEGLVRSVGVSNMAAEQMVALQRHLDLPLVVNQLELSLSKRDWVEAEILVNGDQAVGHDFPLGTLDYCARAGVALQSWGALSRGAYTGGQGDDATPAQQRTATVVASLAERYDVAPESVVLGWLTKHPADVSPVIGTTDPGRIRGCADALQTADRMSHVDWYALFSAARGQDLP